MLKRLQWAITLSLYRYYWWSFGFDIVGGLPLTTAGGGSFVRVNLMRNKRSVQWTVAPIEHAEHRFESY